MKPPLATAAWALATVLLAGLAALPEKFRGILVLSCLDGLSHAECAAILKCSERAIEGRLYRARRRLAEWWERDRG